MVAVIKASSSLRNVLHYNENKLKQNVAQLIHSKNYGKDTEKLGFSDKIKTLEKVSSLNQRTKLNAVHISLNFDTTEKLDQQTLRNIADMYMEKIGFGNQPYLVYEHHDAGHPHIHIVTTNIQRDGSRIKMQNIGRNQSEKARKEIEKEFNLVQAQRRQQKIVFELKPVNVQKVTYGKSETKRAITNVLDYVLPNYRYSSLPELNAVLRQYNVMADRGSEKSRVYKHNGLVYRVLNEKGEKVGVPIKASVIYNKPTLKFLHQKFGENEPLKQKHKQRLKNAIDLSFIKQSAQSLQELTTALQKENIQVVLRQNEKGIVYGITYIDHHSKCVFNGSDLGKAYSANQIQERCGQKQMPERQPILIDQHPVKMPISHKKDQQLIIPYDGSIPKTSALNQMLLELTKIEQEGPLASELRNDEIRRRKKRKLRH